MKPEIYVACLSAYNNDLHGVWIDCSDIDKDEIWSQIEQMLKKSPVNYIECCEEWRIDCYEDWGKIDPTWFDFQQIADIGKYLAQADESTAIAFSYFVSNFDNSRNQDTIIEFEDKYLGCYESPEQFVKERLEEMGVMSQLEKIELVEGVGADCFIDLAKIGHEWEMSDYEFYEAGYNEVYVFCL